MELKECRAADARAAARAPARAAASAAAEEAVVEGEDEAELAPAPAAGMSAGDGKVKAGLAARVDVTGAPDGLRFGLGETRCGSG
jgi:hypothetical protein